MRRVLTMMVLFVVAGFLHVGRIEHAFAQDAPAAGDACVLCADAKTFPCPTCKGSGTAVQVCDVCDGEGRPICVDKLIEESGEGGGHKGTRATCPNVLCRGGKITWDDGKKYACKVCGKKGTIKCKQCDLVARVKCGACRGRGQRKQECGDCAGAGRVLCLLCADAKSCNLCNGTSTARCPRCDGIGETEQSCPDCLSSGSTACRTCAGTTKQACRSCAGTAKSRGRYEDRTTAYSRKCRVCEKKGVTPCRDCKKGLSKCTTCRGTGTAVLHCRLCDGTEKLPCTACGETSYRSGIVGAQLLVAAGHRVEAHTLLSGARTKALASRSAAIARREAVEAEEKVKPPDVSEDSTPAERLEWIKKLTAYMTASSRRFNAIDLARTAEEGHAAAIERIDTALGELAE